MGREFSQHCRVILFVSHTNHLIEIIEDITKEEQ